MSGGGNARWVPSSPLAIALVTLLVAGLVLARALGDTGDGAHAEGGPPSSFSAASGGARALYLVAKDVGLPVVQWMRPLPTDATDPEGGALVIVGPTVPLLPSEITALVRWIERGGHLFYAAPSSFGTQEDALLSALGFSQSPHSSEETNVVAWHAKSESDGGAEILEGAPASLSGFHCRLSELTAAEPTDVPAPRHHREVQPLYVATKQSDPSTANAESMAVVRLRLGRGEAILFADADPLTNRLLHGDGAAVLAIRSFAHLSPKGPLRFDELHHGYDERVGLQPTLLHFLGHTAAGWAIVELGVVAFLATAFAGKRFGAPLPPPPRRLRSAMEQVESLASAYQKMGAVRLPAERLRDWLRLRLGLPSSRALEARLEALAATSPALARAVTELGGGGGGGAGSLLRVSAAVDRLITTRGASRVDGASSGLTESIPPSIRRNEAPRSR